MQSTMRYYYAKIFYDFFVWLLKIKANTKLKNTAAPIPVAVAANPPVKIPITPDEETEFITPLASVLPKPMIGTVAPAFPNSTKGS